MSGKKQELTEKNFRWFVAAYLCRVGYRADTGTTLIVEHRKAAIRRDFEARTVYLRLPTEASLRLTAELLGRACYLNVDRPSTTALRAEIIQHFGPTALLIVDELQQITLARTHRDRLATVEFLREIFDRSGCGMVLCGTNDALRELTSGPNALWLRQLRRRALPRVVLPSVTADEDIQAFAGHFGFNDDLPPEAIEATRRIATDDGVSLLITYMQGAARMAKAEGATLAWDHFFRAVRAFEG